MNKGLLGWPEARGIFTPQPFGWPPQRRDYYGMPRLDEAGIVGTTTSPGATNHVITLPTYAAGDIVCISFKCSANVTPGLPTDWTSIQAGAQGSQGNRMIWKRMNGTEGSTVTITTSSSATSSALAVRISGAGDPVISTPVSTTGGTPLISGIAYTSRAGHIPSLAIALGNSLGTITLFGGGGTGTMPATVFTQYTEAKTLNWQNFYENVESTRRAWVFMAYLLGSSIPGYQGVGTWTNFTIANLLFPAQRRPARQTRG